MSKIEFNNEQKEVLIGKLQKYFTDELDQDIGQFDTEFLLDYISTEIGCYFYNRGLQDAQIILADRIENIVEAIDEIEKPTDFI